MKDFQSLDCWKKARTLVSLIYSIDGKLNQDFDLRSQLRRAAISMMNNIAEGFTRFSDQEKIRFLEIAQSSGNEVKSMLFILKDLDYVPEEQLLDLHDMVDQTNRLILGFIRYLNKTKDKYC